MNNNLKVHDDDYKKKLIKYLLIGIIVSISIRYIPSKQIDNTETLIIGSVASITFGLLDMISPTIIVK